jgi:DNA-binding Lrp family transcriptional regulator
MKSLAKLKARLANPFKKNQVKSFKDTQIKEEAYSTKSKGLRQVPLAQIVGSVGRYHDFDRRFRLKKHLPPDRLQRIKSAYNSGRKLPPVKLYQIKNEFYVLDGNHRIAAAKEIGLNQIDAQILEFISSKSTMENLLYQEKSKFEEASGLEVNIELTEIGQYKHLSDQIKSHQLYLNKDTRQSVSFEQAAQDWYESIYTPLVAIIEKGNLIQHFPNRKLADLYVYITLQLWNQKAPDRYYGIGINRFVPKDMEVFRKKMSTLNESDYPDMLRVITAFVLMTVEGRRELQIVEKLKGLPEVQEVHSVHGSYDIIVKIVLERDLVASDAETIGQFVHHQVRLMPGVLTTQTLIPSYHG